MLNQVGSSNADYSVNFWVNLDATQTNSWRAIAHKGSVDFERTFAAWFRPSLDNRIHHRVSTTANSNEGHDTPTAVGLSTWTMVTLVKEGNQLKTYLDGALNITTNLSGTSVSNTGPLYIGDDPWYDGIRGLIDEFMVFQGALTLTEVQSIRTNHMNGDGWDGAARTCPTLFDEPVAEAGRVTLNNTNIDADSIDVCFASPSPFSTPPSVFSLPTSEGADPATLRISNVTTTGFTILQVESEGRTGTNDGALDAMTVDFVAIEPGNYLLAGSTKLEVGTFSVDEYQGRQFPGGSRGWLDANFTQNFDGGTTPVVVTSIQTMNNETGTPPTTPSMPFFANTVRNVTNTDFDLALERAETSTGGNTLVSETVAYLAIDDGSSGKFNNDFNFQSIRSNQNIRGWQITVVLMCLLELHMAVTHSWLRIKIHVMAAMVAG